MQTIIAANWKMFKTRPQAAQTASELALALAKGTPKGRKAVIFAPFTDIAVTAEALAGVADVAVGGQNFYPEEQGAFTGEISPAMLREAGARWLLTGHSERRHIFGESDALVARKTAYGLEQGFRAVMAGGERISLTYKEFELLRLFMSSPGVAFTREKLLTSIWDSDYSGETRTVDMHIRTLRQKLGSYGAMIETIRNVGYRLEVKP